VAILPSRDNKNKMKKLLLIAALMATLTGCTSSTQYGECVGLADEDSADPKLKYDVSTKNVVLAVVFSETIVVPAVVILGEYKCPVGLKSETATATATK
jgi:ABC-type uncharacterized transport system auxiliary subunit